MITTLARRLLAALLLLVGTLGLGTATVSAEPAPPCTVKSAEHVAFAADGATREYSVRIPPGGATTLTPMVVSLHPPDSPSTSSATTRCSAPTAPALRRAQRKTPISPWASRRQPPPSAWATGRASSRSFRRAQRAVGPADGRLRHGVPAALVEYLHARGCSAPQRTSINGYSMGAMMTLALSAPARTCSPGQRWSAASTPASRLPDSCAHVDRWHPRHGRPGGVLGWHDPGSAEHRGHRVLPVGPTDDDADVGRGEGLRPSHHRQLVRDRRN